MDQLVARALLGKHINIHISAGANQHGSNAIPRAYFAEVQLPIGHQTREAACVVA
jgi:hypothetical protein